MKTKYVIQFLREIWDENYKAYEKSLVALKDTKEVWEDFSWESDSLSIILKELDKRRKSRPNHKFRVKFIVSEILDI